MNTSTSNYKRLLQDGLWRDNPALVMLLGLCPLLAVSNSLINGLALGIATLVTVCITNVVVSLCRNKIEAAVRIPIYVLIIATTVTGIEFLARAFFPGLHQSLGIFLPLIVTNCLILGRAEAFASRHSAASALADGLSMGFGFLWVLAILGGLRELIGQGTLFTDAHLLFNQAEQFSGFRLLGEDKGVLLALLPPGAFIGLGLMIAIKNCLDENYTQSRLSVESSHKVDSTQTLTD